MSMFYPCIRKQPCPAGYDEVFRIRYPSAREILLSGCIGAGLCRWNKGHRTCYPVSLNDGSSLELITRGKFRLSAGEKSIMLHPGDLFFLRRRQGEFVLQAVSEGEKKVILLDQFSNSIHLLTVLFGKEAVIGRLPRTKIEEGFDKVIDAVFDPEKHEEIDPQLFSLFCTINREKRSRLPEPVAKVLSLIEQDLGEVPSRSVLVKEAGVSISTLNRLFQLYFQCSPCEYCKQVRMGHAQQLLGTAGVKETAEACGYSSVSFFCKDFKKRFKVSPGKYAAGLQRG